MAAYVKITNFAVKDGLLSGNPSKIVSGSEIDAELNAIALSSSQNLTAITDAQTAAAASASAASTSASNAATSASTATTQAGNASTSASTATTQASNASTSASNASTSASNASSSASSASTSASTATTQASNASTSATNASNSATAAATSASNAATSASNAANSVTAAIGTTVQAYDADLTTWAGVTPGTGVATALAVAVGSAGALVVNGGALGTPSSGVTDNLTTTTTATAIVDTDFVDTNLAAGGKRKILWTAVKTYLTSTFSTLAQLAASGGAALIGNTPAGSIAATTVQAAINELDTEKAALAGSASQAFSVAAATAAAHAVRADGVIGRNKIINGRFQINQRAYVSAATLASGSYGHDRFKAGASGGDYSFTQNAADTTITIASGKSLIQVIEDVNVSDMAYVLSWSGTAQARYAVNSATPAGSYAASPILITGQTVGTVMSVEFNTGTLGDVQLEAGAIATVYETRHYGTELGLCQRYYQIYAGALSAFRVFQSDVAIRANIFFKVTMRVSPTVVTNGAVGWDAGPTPAINTDGIRYTGNTSSEAYTSGYTASAEL